MADVRVELERVHPELLGPQSVRDLRLTAIRCAGTAEQLAKGLECVLEEQRASAPPAVSRESLQSLVTLIVAQWAVIFGLLAVLVCS